MNITKEQVTKLKYILMTISEESTDASARKSAWDALSSVRGLEDAEPQNRCITALLAFAKEHPGTYLFPGWDGNRVLKYLATSPQAAQTAPQSELSAQAAQALARLPSEGKPIEALAPTEAATWRLTW